MKRYFSLLVFVVLSTLCFSETGNVEVVTAKFPNYQGIVTTDFNATLFYEKASLWAAVVFNSANDVIQHKDKETSTIVCNGIVMLGNPPIKCAQMHFKLTLEGKDGKFRYTVFITDVIGTIGFGNESLYPFYLKEGKFKWAKDALEEKINEWIEEIIHTSTTNDEW
jgi:hypothetical protein